MKNQESPNESVESTIYQMIGMASMCWSETPKGVFDSEKAKEAGDRILDAVSAPKFALQVLKKHMQDKAPGSYRGAWEDNIAMAFKDAWAVNPYDPHTGPTAEHVHMVANTAAKAFMRTILDEHGNSDLPGMLSVVLGHRSEEQGK